MSTYHMEYVSGIGGWNIWQVYSDTNPDFYGYVTQFHAADRVAAALFNTVADARNYVMSYNAKRTYLLGN